METSTSEVLMFIVIFIYLIIIGVYGDKHNKQFEKVRRNKMLFKHKKITSEELQNSILSMKLEIKPIKLVSFILIGIIGLIHSLLNIYYSESVLYPIISLSIFEILMVFVYWFKGSKVIYDNTSEFDNTNNGDLFY